MLKRLEELAARYDELTARLADPAALADRERWTAETKERAELEEVVLAYRDFLATEAEMTKTFAAAEEESDREMKELLTEEGYALKEKLASEREALKILLLPKDKNDERNCILEIRGGAGGDEAALFAYELYRMYQCYCERHRFRFEPVECNETELGGIKEAVVNISGKGAYKALKYESGVHRVQRVPETESQGRVHTSTVTVAVLPEAEDVEVEINEKDIRVDVFRSSGAGGQKVNKTETAIRITHFPTGIVVTCQDERSQLKNKERAFKVLRSRLYDYYSRQNVSEYAQNRRSMIGTGDRSERIRTYNFPQSRVTDHRIGMSLYNIESFLMGEIDALLEALALADREARLSGGEGA